MGLSAISSSTGSGLGPYLSVGLGIGSLFLAVALVYLLAYLNLLAATELDPVVKRYVRRTVVALIVPLLVAFAGIVLLKSLMVL